MNENTPESDMTKKNELDQKVNRKERRNQINFFTKELKKHCAKKPKVNIHEEDIEKQQKTILRIQAWATRYGLLIRKLDSLGYEFKKDDERIHKRSVEQGKLAKQGFKESGKLQIETMQELPNTKSEDNDV